MHTGTTIALTGTLTSMSLAYVLTGMYCKASVAAAVIFLIAAVVSETHGEKKRAKEREQQEKKERMWQTWIQM